jgi:2-dehydro-3-deoxyphosphogluconate aldolase/(4S)-4-hydroxy-2-oxoglutarate aldolase
MTSNRESVGAAVREQRVVAIVREQSGSAALERGAALVEAGVRVVEISLTTPDALGAITELVGAAGDRAVVGAGTVLDTDDAERAIAAGARFLVAPTLSVPVIELAVAADIAVVPGAATPTEMLTAHRAGADFVKIFPASVWTPRAVKDLLAALPQLRLLPTGGVALDTAPDWIRAGAAAVGMGSALSTGNLAELLRSLEPPGA